MALGWRFIYRTRAPAFTACAFDLRTIILALTVAAEQVAPSDSFSNAWGELAIAAMTGHSEVKREPLAAPRFQFGVAFSA